MRLEVLVGSSDPVIYPITQQKIVIGSADNCDIVLPQNGVSRKHLVIVVEDDNYYVADQGSTNGSFMNEERLVPGRRVEFTSFFPVRLGDDVLISLISDDEMSGFTDINIKLNSMKEKTNPAMEMPSSDATRVINLADLGAHQTEKLVRRRQEKRSSIKKTKKEAEVPVKKKKNNSGLYLGILIFAGAAFYQFYLNKPEQLPEAEVPLKVGEVVEIEKVNVPQQPVIKLIADDEITDRASFKYLVNDIKCASDLEKLLCNSIPDNMGVVQVGLMLNVLVDFTSHVEKAKAYLNPPKGDSPELFEKYNQELYQIAASLYLMKTVPQNLDWEQLKDAKLTFAFFKPDLSNAEPLIIAAIYPEALREFQDKIKLDALHFIKRGGFERAMEFTKTYYRTY